MRITGRILSVQEQRFRLLTDNGQMFLLTLARRAALDGASLRSLHLRGTPVEVEFSGEPNLTGAVAHIVKGRLP
ncbi:MAG: hypothetical protein M3069_08980 [Chloroflexota bacterium]|nr:hypothetical protein [Chloroflexota bacterium]